MKRAFFIPVFVVALVTMSCVFTGRSAVEPTVAPAVAVPTATEAAVVQPAQATATSAPAAAPTEKPVEKPTEAPTAAPPAPTAEPKVEEFVETFDRRNENWSEPLTVTTQGGAERFTKVSLDNGNMRFKLAEKETYIYSFYHQGIDGNVSIEASYAPAGHINNGIAVVCRVNDERTQWYEVRLSSNSRYSIFLYDRSIKEEQGKNPYVEVGKGVIDVKMLYPSKPNTFKVTCLDDEILVDVNKGKKELSVLLDTQLEGTGVGIGAMSYDVVPITIDFDTVTIKQEP